MSAHIGLTDKGVVEALGVGGAGLEGVGNNNNNNNNSKSINNNNTSIFTSISTISNSHGSDGSGRG